MTSFEYVILARSAKGVKGLKLSFTQHNRRNSFSKFIDDYPELMWCENVELGNNTSIRKSVDGINWCWISSEARTH